MWLKIEKAIVRHFSLRGSVIKSNLTVFPLASQIREPGFIHCTVLIVRIWQKCCPSAGHQRAYREMKPVGDYVFVARGEKEIFLPRSEEHTSELQSLRHL